MGQLYTQGTWTVKPGNEQLFVTAWTEMAEWTGREVPGSTWAKLLHDRGAPNRFISFGLWESLEAIENWRALDGFQTRVKQLRELIDGFEPSTLELVSEHE
ncbi:MAG: antibiotic biosynthesis monooxygenase [Actinomycetota bacterium]|nr:antibiotic biosynthesis monooxygenase [Actinomycetota bacterium]